MPKSSNHPVIASVEPDERRLYCYIDEVFADYGDAIAPDACCTSGG